MKIGVISDTHGSLTAWNQVSQACFNDIDLILHCGDILYHGPRNPLPEGYDPAGLANALNQSSKPIIFAKGNCDAEVDQLLINYPIEAPYTHLVTPTYRILVHHGHQQTLPDNIYHQYQLIITGHTHLPGIRREGAVTFLNPGSPSLPKNEPKQPTIALIEDFMIRIINPWTLQTIAETTFR